MSTSFLYHRFGIRGYWHVKTEYEGAKVIFTVTTSVGKDVAQGGDCITVIDVGDIPDLGPRPGGSSCFGGSLAAPRAGASFPQGDALILSVIVALLLLGGKRNTRVQLEG